MERINNAMFNYCLCYILDNRLDIDLLPDLMEAAVFGYKVAEKVNERKIRLS